jgi:hypothetical protein
MLNNYSVSYMQIKDINKAKLECQENRIGLIGAVFLFVFYCIVSNMEYNDCINLGVC